MRKVPAIGVVLAMSIVGLSACGSGPGSESTTAQQKAVDTYAIDRLEVVYHQGVSEKNLDMIMALFADHAVVTAGGQSFTGRGQVRNFFAQAAPLKPENHWVSQTSAYKTRVTISGDKGTLYFECHYTDIDTKTVKASVAADTKVARIKGKWLMTNLVATTVALTA